jgi:hypothetical protein
VTSTELGYLSGVTSAIQTQINGKQPLDAELTALAALAVTDGNLIVGNGTTWTVENGATARTSLGLGTLATQNANAVSITGGSITGITDLAITEGGTGASNATNARANLGLGSMATQSSVSVTISGGSITGITDLAIADGGTGASTAAQALINFGITATAAELNKLDGVTATTAELNFVDGVTSPIQTQLDAKQASDATLTALAGINSMRTPTTPSRCFLSPSTHLCALRQCSATASPNMPIPSFLQVILPLTEWKKAVELARRMVPLCSMWHRRNLG